MKVSYPNDGMGSWWCLRIGARKSHRGGRWGCENHSYICKMKRALQKHEKQQPWMCLKETKLAHQQLRSSLITISDLVHSILGVTSPNVRAETSLLAASWGWQILQDLTYTFVSDRGSVSPDMNSGHWLCHPVILWVFICSFTHVRSQFERHYTLN